MNKPNPRKILTVTAAFCASVTLANAEVVTAPTVVQLNGVDDSYTGLTGDGTIENGSATTDATLTVDVTSNQTFAGILQDGGAAKLGLTKTGGSKLILSGDSTYTGDTTISGGILEFGDGGSLGGTNHPGNISIAAGAELRLSDSTHGFSGVISGDGQIRITDRAPVTLSGANTYTGATLLIPEARFGNKLTVFSLNSVSSPPQQPSSSLGVPVDAAAGTIVISTGAKQASYTLQYDGVGEETDRILNFNFNGSSGQTLINNTAEEGVLTFTSAFDINRSSGNSAGRLTLTGTGDGEAAGGMTGGIVPGELLKSGSGTWTIGAASTVDDLRVTSGVLVIDAGGTIDATDSDPDGTGVVTASGGTLTVNGTLKFVTATVSGGTVDGSGTLNYDIDGTTADQLAVTSGTLDITGLAVEVVPGEVSGGLTESEYILVDATDVGYTGTFTGLSGATGYELDYGTTDQVKLVVSGGSSSPYEDWAPEAPDNLFADDKNGDGISNGLAFLLGAGDATEDATLLLPTVSESSTDLVLTFSMLNAANRGGADVLLQWSSDLGETDLWADNQETVPDASGTPATVTYSVTENGDFNDVVATIPGSENAGGKLFGRLTASEE